MSDPLLTVCPECGQDTYVKQVTSAGFHLKGTGWYVTDFRNNGSNAKPDAAASVAGSAGTAAPAAAAAPAPAAAAASAASAAAPKPPASTSSS